MPIHILPADIASQIAAGEVVERPASVVKELLENSIDAKADNIRIEIQDAGRRLIEVLDNGIGIPNGELALAVERHATSKLQDAEDLFNIHTLGFRGEALASIGSVSRLTITSRTAGSETGARLQVEGGRNTKVSTVGSPVGTVVQVENLFYNVPARLKFLKHQTTERRHIDQLVALYATAYPNVRFYLSQEDRVAIQTSGNGDRREVLGILYGPDVARQLLEVITEDSGMHIFGFVSPASLTRSNRREMNFFVNGRPVQDTSLSAALLKAYHTMLMVGRYPLAALFIEIPADLVDVNVHPTKAEIRFREPERVFSGVQRAVRRALLAHTPIPTLADPLPWPTHARRKEADFPWQNQDNRDNFIKQADFSDKASPGVINSQPEQAGTAPLSVQPGSQEARVPILRLIGQIANTYLIAEGPDGLYLIDQHAAHERILYEKMTAMEKQPLGSQAFLQPVVVELPSAGARLVDVHISLLSELGFQIESFGPNTYLVRAVPSILKNSDPAAILRVLVEDFEEDETPLGSFLEARLIARICKRAAIKAGQTLSAKEQETLLMDLENCQSPRTCPHGRPTMIHLSVDLLERQFGRRGAR